MTNTMRRWLRLGSMVLSMGGVTLGCARSDFARTGRASLPDGLHGATAPVEFSVHWPGAHRGPINWDAVWLFVKFQREDGGWSHASLSPRAEAHGIRDANGIEAVLAPSGDGRGVFAYRRTPGTGGAHWDDVRLAWDYGSDDVAAGDRIRVRAYAIEMVFVPEGPFVVGDGEPGNIRGHFRGATGDPFVVAGESPIPLGGGRPSALGNSNGYGTDSTLRDDFDDGTTAQLPAPFPKGHSAFYIMKHELTQGAYAQFLNTLTEGQRTARNPANDRDRPRRPGVERYSITATAPFIALQPDLVYGGGSWMDAAAFADWAGLRPLTELEYEKAGRGPIEPLPGEFAWGSTFLHRGRYALAEAGTPMERVNNPGPEGNAAYRATTGGGDRSCPSCLGGPLPAGAFARDGAARGAAGASFYGVLDLSGNLVERYVTVGNASGRTFDGRHGDGILSDDGHAAGADVATWPGSTRLGDRSQVIGAAGSGFRGGSWASGPEDLRLSDRVRAAVPDGRRDPRFGYRFGRTAPNQP